MFFSAISLLNLCGVASDQPILGLCLSVFIYMVALYILLSMAVTINETIRDWPCMTMPMFVIGCFGGLFLFAPQLINRIRFRDTFEVCAPTQYDMFVRRLVWKRLRAFSMRLKEMFEKLEELEKVVKASPTPNQIDQIRAQKAACIQVESSLWRAFHIARREEQIDSSRPGSKKWGWKDFLPTYDEVFGTNR